MQGANSKLWLGLGAGVALSLMGAVTTAQAAAYNLTAVDGIVTTPDGGQLYMWSFTDTGTFRYPGPTIQAVAGDTVTVSLTNSLPDTDGAGPNTPDPVSIVFAGQQNVEFSNDGGATFHPVTPAYSVPGSRDSLSSFVPEAAPGQTVIYRFVATAPGTFQYYSGTQPQKHVDMGLVGGLVIRPGTPGMAYNALGTDYDYEHLLLLTEVDPGQHERVQVGLPYQASAFKADYWFINGRSFPDTLAPDNASYLPAQPMGALIAMYPGERILLRLIDLGRKQHPMHHHGSNGTIVAINGRPLSSDGGVTADLARDRYTPTPQPGETIDSIYYWDAPHQDMGWDVMGMDPTRPAPVTVLPNMDNPNAQLIYGELYSGSPYLGQQAALPAAVQAVSLNMFGEHYVPFHSHHEFELQNQGEGPGGMLTFIMICSPNGPCGHATQPVARLLTPPAVP
ncbi:MAG: copper oxidase [Nitrospirota bacterium]|nr:copper oxidase [Nitrospirota bacterium]